MNKTVLRNIHLVNWYGFANTTIPFSEDLTLISGENECGKSTILDALKYAYTGDTQFNKATSNGNTGLGKRNLVSYTRCLLDPSSGIYARPVDKMPNVYTHIALEYFDQVNNHSFILGVIIETGTTDIRGTYWYALDGKTLKDIQFVYEDQKLLKPYDVVGFKNKYKAEMKSKKEGITLFMQKTGLRIPYHDVAKYQRKLRNIMAYNPSAKIQEFIKESVLEEHDVNFDKLKDAKKNIETLNNSMEQINQEIKDLDSILNDFAEHDKKALTIKVDDIKILYKELLLSRKNLEADEAVINESRMTSELLESKIRDEDKEINEIENAYLEAKSALQANDVAKAVETSKKLISGYKEQLDVLESSKGKLEAFQVKLQEIANRLENFAHKDEMLNTAEMIVLEEEEAAAKKRCIEVVKEKLLIFRDEIIEQLSLLKKELSGIQTEGSRLQEIIDNCNKNKADYSLVREQISLIDEINREFKKRNIQEEAHMACEYVSEVKDEKWRNAIEAFLGIHRYAIIVPANCFDVANDVFDHSRNRYVELVNTKRLMARELECEEDSVFHFLTIQNENAAAYFKFLLGRIHAVPIDKVPDYDNAMSMEGKLSRNMAVTYINTKKIKSYCLGSEAIEINKRAAEKNLKELEEQEKDILDRQKKLSDVSAYLKNAQTYFKDYDLNAHREWKRVSFELHNEKKHYEELLEAQKKDSEFFALTNRVSQLSHSLRDKKNEREENIKKKTRLDVLADEKAKLVDGYKLKISQREKALDVERMLNPTATERAMEEYDKFLLSDSQTGGLMSSEYKERKKRRVRDLENNINGKQQAYNNRKQDVDRLPIGLDVEAAYQKRRGKIWIDDLQGIQQKLRRQTANYERIFKSEFVLSIYATAKEAKMDIDAINQELRKLQFSTRYRFDVKLLEDHSDYAKILQYAEYLQKTNNMEDGQMSLTTLFGYNDKEVEEREKEIHDIINRIVEKNDHAEIKKYADYRNYMTYEIIINNDEVKDGKLSKQMGYNSGAGTQIPYTLILTAALSMIYNARVNSVRLIFIDEPFEKMSDSNIKKMLEFFKNQNLQVIFCAPPNKLESIGSECGVIIPVLKRSNDRMQIGKVKFHESGV